MNLPTARTSGVRLTEMHGLKLRASWGEPPTNTMSRKGELFLMSMARASRLGSRFPAFAVLHPENGQKEKLPVIAIQAESHIAGQVLIGYRPLSGGNGICTLDEIDLLDAPDEQYFECPERTGSSD